jgi:hypothetical protein
LFQIRCCREDEGPVVELDLACGVFDLKDETAIAAAERSLINQGVAVEKFSGGSSSSSDSGTSSSDEDSKESSSDSENEEDKDKFEKKIVDEKLHKKGKGKKPPMHHHPGIQELS